MSLDSVAHARALVDDMDGAEVDGFPLRISLARCDPMGPHWGSPGSSVAFTPGNQAAPVVVPIFLICWGEGGFAYRDTIVLV